MTAPTSSAQHQDQPYLGVLLMLGFCVLAPLGDGLAKQLGGTLSTGALVLVRFGVQAAVLVPLMLVMRLAMPPRDVMGLLALRTALHIAGIGLMFSSLRFLPLADAIAIAFIMPFLALLAGNLFLSETVGPHRLAACAVGFVGTLMVMQPNFVEVGWPAALPLGVAVVFTAFMLVTRMIARAADPIALQGVSGVMAVIVLVPVMLIWPDQPLWTLAGLGAVRLDHLLWLGLLGTLAHLMMTWSLRFAPSATLAPMQYLEIPMATLIGWWMFAQLPNGLAAIGICITIAAGLYIIARERQIAGRQARPPAPPPAA